MNERKIQPDRRGGNDKLERPKTICIARILKITNGLSEYHQNWRTGIDWNIKNEIWQQNTERHGGVSNGLVH